MSQLPPSDPNYASVGPSGVPGPQAAAAPAPADPPAPASDVPATPGAVALAADTTTGDEAVHVTPNTSSLKPGSTVAYSYIDHRGDITDYGIVVAVENRSHTNPDGSITDEGPHVVVAWLRDLSHPLPVGLFEQA